MLSLRQTEEFATWFRGLRDRSAMKRIAARLDRAAAGHFGDAEPVGDGVREMRLHFGPGYRIYFIQRERVVVVLLCGGDKATQGADVRRAKALAKEYDDGAEDHRL